MAVYLDPVLLREPQQRLGRVEAHRYSGFIPGLFQQRFGGGVIFLKHGSPSLHFLLDLLAEDARRPDQEHENQDAEDNGVGQFG